MTTWKSYLFSSLALLLSTLPFLAPDAVRITQEEGEAEEHSELEEHMEIVEEAVKRLRRSIRDDANRAASLGYLDQLQEATVRTKSMFPPLAESVPEAERAAFVAGYREMMVDFLDAQLDLERAVLAGDLEAAKAAFGVVHDFEDTGHEAYTEDE